MKTCPNCNHPVVLYKDFTPADLYRPSKDDIEHIDCDKSLYMQVERNAPELTRSFKKETISELKDLLKMHEGLQISDVKQCK